MEFYDPPHLKPFNQSPAKCSSKTGQEAPAADLPGEQGKHADFWAQPQIHASESEWKGTFL